MKDDLPKEKMKELMEKIWENKLENSQMNLIPVIKSLFCPIVPNWNLINSYDII